MKFFNLTAFIFFSLFAIQIVSGPNILIIFTDDQGYADLGCFRSKENQTPVISLLLCPAGLRAITLRSADRSISRA